MILWSSSSAGIDQSIMMYRKADHKYQAQVSLQLVRLLNMSLSSAAPGRGELDGRGLTRLRHRAHRQAGVAGWDLAVAARILPGAWQLTWRCPLATAALMSPRLILQGSHPALIPSLHVICVCRHCPAGSTRAQLLAVVHDDSQPLRLHATTRAVRVGTEVRPAHRATHRSLSRQPW
jgi:hypothetical protein